MVSGLCQKESRNCSVLPFAALLGKATQPSRLQSCRLQTLSRLCSSFYQAVISQEHYPNTATQMLLFLQVRALQQTWHLPFHLSWTLLPDFSVLTSFLMSLPSSMSGHCLITTHGSLGPLESSSISLSWHWRTSMIEQWILAPKDLLILLTLPRVSQGCHFSSHI